LPALDALAHLGRRDVARDRRQQMDLRLPQHDFVRVARFGAPQLFRRHHQPQRVQAEARAAGDDKIARVEQRVVALPGGDFEELVREIGYMPHDDIPVILYTQQQYFDVTRAPTWTGALNDGKLRIPIQGLTTMTTELSKTLKHELAHSFINQLTHGRCPTWLQEGVAQFMEGRRSRDAAATLVDAYEHNSAPGFAQMEGSWMALSADSAAFAYAWSLAAVEAIVSNGGMSDISRLLDHVATDSSTEAALIAALRMDYAELAHQTSAYLRRNYVR